MDFTKEFNYRNFYSQKDQFYWNEIESLFKNYNLSLKTILTNYMAFTQRRDLPQLLAYYDLYKEVKDLPGSIIEVGVFIGNGMFTWSKLMETFQPGNRGVKVFGFDNFSGYSEEVSECDNKAIEYIKSLVGDFKIDYDFVSKLVELHNLDSLIPGVERLKLYNGKLSDSFKKFKEENNGVRVKLLLVDVNLYTPTIKSLESLYELVIPGGIIALRGYGVKPWEGESKAVDEFLNKHKINNIKAFSFSNYPAIYFKKLL